jgi:chorismate-pyruvate lyase
MAAPTSPDIGVNPYAYPLDEFYAQAGRVLPQIEVLDGPAVPEPFRSLLVHTNDMTPTLEKFHGDTIHLSVLGRQQRDGFYFREVLLLTDGSTVPLEFGAIKINLNLFPPAARRQILDERLPLGHILSDHKIAHSSRPKAFLKIHADQFIAETLRLAGRPILYGRRNTLSDPGQRSLAEIVEILPPIPTRMMAA